MTDLIDSNLPSSQDYRELKDEFSLKHSLFLTLEPIDKKWQRNNFQELKQWVKYEAFSFEGIDNIISPFNFYEPILEKNEYIFYLYSLKENSSLSFSKQLRNFYKAPWGPLFTNKKGRDFSLEINLQEPKDDSKLGSFNPQAIQRILSSIHKNFSENYKYYLSGSGLYTFYAFKGVKSNFVLNFVFLFVILIILKYFFGTFRAGIIYALTIFWVGLCVYGLMGFLNLPIEILSSALFIMIAVSSLEDYFFLLHQELKGLSFQESIKSIRYPSLLTSLTTVIGFGSLYFSGIDIIGRFGITAALGALLEWFAVFILLPTFLNFFNITQLTKPLKAKGAKAKIWSVLIKRFIPNRHFAKIIFLCFPISIFLLFNLQVADSPLSLFPENHVMNVATNKLKNSKGWQGQASVIFTSLKNDHFIKEIHDLDNVVQIESFLTTSQHLTRNIPKDYKKAIVNDLEVSEFSKRYISKNLNMRQIIYLKSINFIDLKKMKSQIKNICGENCKLVGEIISYIEFMEKIPLGFMKSLGISVFLVAFIIFIIALIQKFPSPLNFTLANIWGPSILIIMMSLLDIHVNFLSCVFVTMMIGLTGDNAIQVLLAHKEESDGLRYHQKCALQLGCLLALLSLLFRFSYFAPPKDFSLLLAIGFLLSTFGDIFIAKALIKKDQKV